MKVKMFFGVLLLLSLPLLNYAQDNTSDTSELSPVAKMLLNHTYQFTATYMQPMTGRQRYIASDGYTLKVSKEKVEADLPYFGKATVAPVNPDEAGIKFTSKDFVYQSTTLTKAREQITIQPKDVTDIQQVYLIVYPDGTADLRINSNSKQAISYTGKISALKADK